MLGVKLSQLLGQPQASAFLRTVVRNGRYANAYLFHGPAGVGKLTAALAFANAILCHSKQSDDSAAPAAPGLGLFDAAAPAAPPASAAPGDDACGECSTCHKSRTLSHPDLKFLFPVSGEEKDLAETIAETHVELREDPLFVFRYEKAASIRLSVTREILRELAFRPFESTRRVVVVRDADRMREDQCSALLKSVEEPGASTVWVLTTSRLSRLPATIRSRCQRVRFSPLTEAMVLGVLQGQAGMPEKEARLSAALGSGSLARALEFREGPGAAKLRNDAMGLLEPALRKDPAALWLTAQKFMNFGRTGRDSLRRMVEFHQLWLRDLLRARYGGEGMTLVHDDRAAEIRALAAKVDATEIRRRLMVLEELLRSIDGNVSADASVFSAMMRVAGERLGERDWPRHSTARWNY